MSACPSGPIPRATLRKNSRRPRFPAGNSRGDHAWKYADDEVEFMLAMDRYKRDQRRPFPAWSEVLAVLKGLGYRKPRRRVA
jgi:hypothetical protein